PGNDQRDDPPTEDVALPVPRAGRQDLGDEADGSRAAQADVEEPGPGDDDLADPALPEQMPAQDAGHPLRGLTGGPGELEGDTGGVVPAPPATRRRDHDPLGHGHVQLPLLDSTTHRAQHGAGELDGGHGTSVGEEGGG